MNNENKSNLIPNMFATAFLVLLSFVMYRVGVSYEFSQVFKIIYWILTGIIKACTGFDFLAIILDIFINVTIETLEEEGYFPKDIHIVIDKTLTTDETMDLLKQVLPEAVFISYKDHMKVKEGDDETNE